jgi:hypothetical protein
MKKKFGFLGFIFILIAVILNVISFYVVPFLFENFVLDIKNESFESYLNLTNLGMNISLVSTVLSLVFLVLSIIFSILSLVRKEEKWHGKVALVICILYIILIIIIFYLFSLGYSDLTYFPTRFGKWGLL